MDNVTERVARQYKAYAYPEPYDDLDERLAKGQFEACNPRFFAPLFWPEGTPPENLRILSAGCGTVQAAALAHSNPKASVVGVDLSDTSLGHQRFLREKYALQNLELFQGDLLEVGKIGREFDLIACTGVLHHMADPDAGLRALRSVLAPGGAMFIMVYGAVGRVGVYMLQDAFRAIGLQQTPEDVQRVRATLTMLQPGHPAQSYVSRALDLGPDNGIVDTFLHPQDRAYTVPEILAWAERADLGFQCWVENLFYHPDSVVPPPLQERLAALPQREQWAAVEKIGGFISAHSFILRRPGEVCDVSFEGQEWLRYRPYRFPGAHLRKDDDGAFGIYRADNLFAVSQAEAAMFNGSDGNRTIAQMADDPLFSRFPEADRHAFARSYFARMWRLGLTMFQY